MDVLFVSPEVVPFAKTGGLADVTSALPKSLSRLGINVSIIMPLYRVVKRRFSSLRKLDRTVHVPLGDSVLSAALWTTKIADSNILVYFIERDEFYDREGLYNTQEGDYADNAGRFIFFSRGALEAIRELQLKVDIIHCHDWQSALIPVYVRTLYSEDPLIRHVKTVLTIHNLAFQGIFWHWDMKLACLDWSLFNFRQLEFYGKMNFLKGGIVFADAITTVSRKYSEEIQTEEFGFGLESVLKFHSVKLTGILNGIDYAEWDPRTDRFIPRNYGPDNLAGKQECKEHLRKKLGLPEANFPLIGSIGRLTEQKGHDIIEQVADKLMLLDAQFVILGTGDLRYHEFYTRLAQQYPGKVAVRLTFDEQLAHEIEAGCDFFLMPSRFEPCGLNQMISLRYGTIPIVRRTGGLHDTIVDYSPATLADGTANGFSFIDYNGNALLECIRRALGVYSKPALWRRLVGNAISQDWSWDRSAREYSSLYEKVMRT